MAKGCSISGQLRLESNMQVDGQIDGQIHVEKSLVISESGCVSGEIYAEHVIVNGEFEGICHADKIEILSKGRVNGSIYSDDLSIEQGGRFNGVTYPAEQSKVAELVEISEVKMAAEG
ncbi:polymer-forming cytoskeletal protein [Vibrio furnissii]|nr:polymer-forming cytoskeletal protein [Vibrio furnissii]TRN25276.1 polymer-forming cytoskeletal family protein [Vibrio furnissii]UON51141.1 polymer-forming cytoskeletal protein [Vibrio furnissii]